MYLSNGSGTDSASRGEPTITRLVPLRRTNPGPEYKSMYTRVGHLFFIPVEKSLSYRATSVCLSCVHGPTSEHGSPSSSGTISTIATFQIDTGRGYQSL